MERHPIQEPQRPQTLEDAGEQIRLAYIRIAQLWDQVWWLSLPAEKRAEYEAQGFTAPIQKFYGPEA